MTARLIEAAFITHEVDPTETRRNLVRLTDTRNRVLELIEIFKRVYNLTMQADVQFRHAGIPAQDKYFEENLPPIYTAGLFWSIMPSMNSSADDDHSNHTVIAERFNRIFAEIGGTGILRAYAPHNDESAREIATRELDWAKAYAQEIYDHSWLRKRLDKARGIEEIAEERRLWLLSALAGDDELSVGIRDAAINRISYIAGGTVFEPAKVLSELKTACNEGDPTRIAALLQEAKTIPSADLWRPLLLHFEAKHLINMGEFPKAKRLLREARKASMEGSFGGIRGEISRDLFALEMSRGKFNRQNHAALHQDLIAYGMFENSSFCTMFGKITPDAKHTSIQVKEYFFDTLYTPYKQ